MDPFDFEAWRDLAQRDPHAFFLERERAIETFISSHPEAAGELRALQAQIDGMRAIAGSPMHALRGIASLLGDHLQALAGNLRQLREEADRLRARLDSSD